MRQEFLRNLQVLSASFGNQLSIVRQHFVICNLWNGSFFGLLRHWQRQKMAMIPIRMTPPTTLTAMIALVFCLLVTPTAHSNEK
jgi:hypothetical protein